MNYLIHSSLLAVLLFGVYKLWLSRETFFELNRCYLLFLPLVSMLLPLVVVPFPNIYSMYKPAVPEALRPYNTALTMNDIIVEDVVQSPLVFPPMEEVFFLLYGIGVVVAFIILLQKIALLQVLLDRCKVYLYGRHYIHLTEVPKIAFSCLNYIVVSKDHSQPQRASIIEHELIHTQGRHSWDLLFYEALRVVFWFHPIAYLAQKELQSLHEYIVDSKLSRNSRLDYLTLLLTGPLGAAPNTFMNTFSNKSSLKNRIAMLHKKPSTQRKLYRLTYLLPILLCSLLYTACSEEQTPEQQTIETIEIDGTTYQTRKSFVPG